MNRVEFMETLSRLLQDIPEEDNRDVDIAPGESIMAAVCFELRSNSPVEVILEDFWNDAYIGLVIPAA